MSITTSKIASKLCPITLYYSYISHYFLHGDCGRKERTKKHIVLLAPALISNVYLISNNSQSVRAEAEDLIFRRKGAEKQRGVASAYRNREEFDEITGTSAWRQLDPRDGIKFSFGARSRVTNYRYRGPPLPPLPPPSVARQIDFRWTFGFSSVTEAIYRSNDARDAHRCPSADDCKPNNGAPKIHAARAANFIRGRGN